MSMPAGNPPYVEALSAAIQAAVSAEYNRDLEILRVEVEAPGLDPLAWLDAQQDQKRGYWADRDGVREVALVGEADEIKGAVAGDFQAWENAVQERLRRARGDVRYYGGFRFGPWHERDLSWRPFGAYRFILPRFEVARDDKGGRWIAANLVRSPDGSWAGPDLHALHPARDAYAASPLPRVRGRRDEPDAETWRVSVDRVQAAMKAGRVEKVVLARRALMTLEKPADPLALLDGIRRSTGKCFQFCGSHGAGFAFVGASPERLYRRVGRLLDSEAVAGTRPRGGDRANDHDLEMELRSNPKEMREHQLVRNRIVHGLSALSERVESAREPGVLKLGRVQHLHTPIYAALHPSTTDADLLAKLHPTPATAGEPVAEAMALLGQLEPFDRGWYAGPVGWVGRDAAEFAVALRCGLLAQSNLILYAGAGIMPASSADAEAREIESKWAAFMNLLESP